MKLVVYQQTIPVQIEQHTEFLSTAFDRIHIKQLGCTADNLALQQSTPKLYFVARKRKDKYGKNKDMHKY